MATPQRPVVVGIDGSDSSTAAFAHGAWEAHRLGVPLRLVFAHSATVPYGLMGLAPDPELLTAAPEGATELVSDLAAQARQAYPGLHVEPTVEPGGAGAVLVEQSRAAQLVVVGCRGLGGFSGLMLGSVGLQLTAHSAAPVIVIRPPDAQANLGAPPPSLPVVVGVDGLPASTAALEFAAAEASARDVELIALYAWWMLPPSRPLPGTANGPVHYDLAAAEEQARQLLAAATTVVRERFPDLQVTLRPVHAANPIVALLDAARTAGLLVVSRHGGNALSRLLFSSIGDVAAREAACPVAIVPEVGA